MKRINFKIDFTLQQYNAGKMTTPFKIIFQTSNKKIENYCKEKWPELLQEKMWNMQEKRKLVAMQSYIKKNLMKSDLENIEKLFYDEKWFRDFTLSDKITSIKTVEVDCKTWTDKSTPYLEYKGIITTNIHKIVDLFFKKRLISLKVDNRFVKMDVEMFFNRSWPFFLMYQNKTTSSQVIMKYMQKLSMSSKSELSKKLSKITGIKDIYTFKKILTWTPLERGIKIVIDDYFKLLKLKAKKSLFPMVVGGGALYLFNRRMSKRK